MIPVISVVGHSDSGKTTLIEGLLKELKRRGLRVATVKHDVHGFDIDIPGKDTWRHAQAGADIVVISSPAKVALIEKVSQERGLEQICAGLEGKADLVLTEGYKRESMPKIETLWKAEGKGLLSDEDELLAVVAEAPIETSKPRFSFADLPQLTDLIQRFVQDNGE